MLNMTDIGTATQIRAPRHAGAALWRAIVIGLISFLTLVDLFATQAILPSLVKVYRVSPAMMGFAVNASTIGMAVAGMAIALASRRINRRQGIWISLLLLSIPTCLLGSMPSITIFTALRIGQGIFMSSAFTLTLAYLAEQSSADDAATASAAYITGNVASNLFGRLLSAALADHLGLAENFYLFALLNVTGALLVYFSLGRAMPMPMIASPASSSFAIWLQHLRNSSLRASFGIGFCILSAFIGTFTFVNFVLVREPFAIGPMALGFVYLVFLPSILTTPFAGRLAGRFGVRPVFWGSLSVAGVGLALLLAPSLDPVLAGLALVAIGTFFAQATATGFVGRAARTDRASASGIYLACYFLGGLAGSAILGHIFDSFGWVPTVAGIALSLLVAALLAFGMKMSHSKSNSPSAQTFPQR